MEFKSLQNTKGKSDILQKPRVNASYSPESHCRVFTVIILYSWRDALRRGFHRAEAAHGLPSRR